MSSLAGRTALVTGGGSGLGAAISRRLHAEGVRVVVAGRRSDPLQRLADELGNGIRAEVCHVADPDSVADLAHRLSGEQISILINNAGIAGPTGGTPEKPVGTVCLCIASSGASEERTVRLPGSRRDVRDRTTTVALHMLRALLMR